MISAFAPRSWVNPTPRAVAKRIEVASIASSSFRLLGQSQFVSPRTSRFEGEIAMLISSSLSYLSKVYYGT